MSAEKLIEIKYLLNQTIRKENAYRIYRIVSITGCLAHVSSPDSRPGIHGMRSRKGHLAINAWRLAWMTPFFRRPFSLNPCLRALYQRQKKTPPKRGSRQKYKPPDGDDFSYLAAGAAGAAGAGIWGATGAP